MRTVWFRGVTFWMLAALFRNRRRHALFFSDCNRNCKERACFNGCRPNSRKLKKISAAAAKVCYSWAIEAGSGHFCWVFGFCWCYGGFWPYFATCHVRLDLNLIGEESGIFRNSNGSLYALYHYTLAGEFFDKELANCENLVSKLQDKWNAATTGWTTSGPHWAAEAWVSKLAMAYSFITIFGVAIPGRFVTAVWVMAKSL